MRNTATLQSILVLSAVALMSCGSTDDTSEETPGLQTIVKGRVYDVERQENIQDFKRTLIKHWQCTSGTQAAICTEFVDSLRTNGNGEYEFTFDYISDGKSYGFEQEYYGSPYYTEPIQSFATIVPGETNVIDVNAWRPVIIKLDLQILNNNFSPLRIDNKVVASDNLHFPQESVFELNQNTVIYLKSKPNSNVELNFHYVTGNSNDDYHSFRQMIQTTLQDTITFQFNIDCSTF